MHTLQGNAPMGYIGIQIITFVTMQGMQNVARIRQCVSINFKNIQKIFGLEITENFVKLL